MIITFLKDNIGSIVAGAIVALIIFFAVRSVIKSHKKGGCSCGCSSCSGKCPHCITPVNKEERNEVK